MNHQIAYECGYLDADRLLRAGTYISPYATLEHTLFTINDGELQSYYEGCKDAVINHKNTNENHISHHQIQHDALP
jgi:hypothetical protein